MLALTFFVFFSYPKSWQKNRIVKIVLLIQHSLGSLALGIVFICYKDVPYEWMKWIVSRWATIYQVTVIMLSAFFFIRLIISKCYHLIRKNSDFEKRDLLQAKSFILSCLLCCLMLFRLLALSILGKFTPLHMMLTLICMNGIKTFGELY